MADSGNPPPKGRVRARGRARGADKPPQAARRPVEVTAQQAGAAPARVPVPAAAAAPAPAAVSQLNIPKGRSTKRGAEHAVQPSSVTTVTQAMGAMGVRGDVEVAGAYGEPDNGRAAAGRGAVRGEQAFRQPRRDFQPDPEVNPSVGVGKQGNSGTLVKLAANYFSVDKFSDTFLYQYHVDFNPDIENSRMRKGMLYDISPNLNFGKYMFDGMALWCGRKLKDEVTTTTAIRKTDDAKIRIQIKFIKEVSTNDPIILQILSIQMRKNFTYLDFKEIDRQYYDIKRTTSLPQQGMEFIPGFSTAIRQHQEKVLMNVELKFKFMRQNTVLNVITELHNKNRNTFTVEAEKKLLGAIIMTKYNSATYRIDEIKWDMTPRDNFKQRRGNTDISYIDYMKQHYNIDVTVPEQPLIMSKPKAKDLKRGDVTVRYLIPEFCVLTGIDDEIRANTQATREIASHTRVSPEDRVNKLTEFMNAMNNDARVQDDMKKWEFKFSRDLVKFFGRNLGCENIIMTVDDAATGQGYDVKSADWTRVVNRQRLLEPVGIRSWLLIHDKRNDGVARDFLTNFRRICPPMGIEFQQPRIIACPDDRTTTYSQVLRNELTSSDKYQMVVAIVPNNRKDRYDAIKKICCIDHGVPSQVIVTRSLSRPNTIMSVVTKVAIQMNCKLGGQVWRVGIPFENLMVVGIDSYHDSSQRNRSVCAVVCSMNRFMTKYHSQVSFQVARQEMTDAFVAQLIGALKNYHRINKKLPDPVFFYRDGVGDGQLHQVREWEIQQINSAFEAVDKKYKPRMAFVIVNKRINTRFFQFAGPNRWVNPLSGTVVDSVVTRPERYDFYLVSQSVREGTVGPTQYNVIYDRSNLQPDRMQRFTYKLTHLYYNWQGTIRVPAPCQYAHKLAFLVGQSLHATPSDRLVDTLYYL